MNPRMSFVEDLKSIQELSGRTMCNTAAPGFFPVSRCFVVVLF